MLNSTAWKKQKPVPTMTDVHAFNGARLTLARSFHQFTLKRLAETVSVSLATIGHYERGFRRRPAADFVAALAQALNVRPTFFFAPLTDVWRESECSFRRRAATPEGVKRRARAHGTLIGLVIHELARCGVRLPTYNFPDAAGATSAEAIESAAGLCRQRWGLGQGPISHIGRVAEHNGAILIRHLTHADKIDAFARRSDFGVIVLNMARTSTSRWIFDVAHEIGHFVLHGGIETGSRATEAQANCFASCLLLPRRTFTREFRSSRFSWSHVFSLKRRWRVSAAAIIRRAYDIGLLDAITYRRCYQHMSTRGWLKAEPWEPEFVGPEWLSSAFDLAAMRFGLQSATLCKRLHLERKTFEAVTGTSCARENTLIFRPK